MNYDQEVGARLKEARIARGLDRPQVAKDLSIGLSTLQLHENGTRGLKAQTIAQYCRYYNIRVGWLLEGFGGMERHDDEIKAVLDQIDDEAKKEVWLKMGRMLAEDD